VELDRHYIERKDFTVARRGYDQEEVDLHLRRLADAITELRAQLKATPAGVAGAAAEQVRQIVEAAEESAAQIEERANEEARRVTEDASRRAKETRDRADQESAEQVQRVQETAAKMLDRLSSLEKELDTLVQGIHEGAAGLVDRMRGGAGDLEGELESIRQELLTVRPAEPEPVRAQEPLEPEPVEPEPLAASEDVAAAPAGWPDVGNGASEPAAAEPEPDATPEPEVAAEPAAAAGLGGAGPEGARLVALNMALNGTPREEAARYLADNFQLDDQEAILDDVYSRVGGRA
jgi:DivIVA domain-containing protein